MGLPRLQDECLLREELGRHEQRVLHLDERAERAVVILDEVLPPDLPYDGVRSRHRDVITDADIAGRVPPYLQLRLVLSIQDEEYFRLRELFLVVVGAQRLQYYVVILRLLDLDDVHDTIIDVDGEGKLLAAEFAVDLLVLQDDVPFHCLHVLVLLQPLPEALQVDATHGA